GGARGSYLRTRSGPSAFFRRKPAAPMFGDVDAAAEPDPVEAAHMFEQLDQSAASSRPADEAIVQADREQLRRPLAALAVEQIEGVAHVGEKIVRGREAAVFIEAIVIGFV